MLWAPIILGLILEWDVALFSSIYTYSVSNFDSVIEGEIVSSRKTYPGQRGTWFSIEYRYLVLGMENKSSQVNFFNGEVDDVLRRYPVGKKVTVHYDSSHPTRSTLEIRHPGTELYYRFFGWLAILLLSIFFLGPEEIYKLGRFKRSIMGKEKPIDKKALDNFPENRK